MAVKICVFRIANISFLTFSTLANKTLISYSGGSLKTKQSYGLSVTFGDAESEMLDSRIYDGNFEFLKSIALEKN